MYSGMQSLKLINVFISNDLKLLYRLKSNNLYISAFNKKKYLYLKALEIANKEDQQKLHYFYNQKLEENSMKIDQVTRVFYRNDIPKLIKEQIADYTNKAFETLKDLNTSDINKEKLRKFGLMLMKRDV